MSRPTPASARNGVAQGVGGAGMGGKLECSSEGCIPPIEKPDIDGGTAGLSLLLSIDERLRSAIKFGQHSIVGRLPL
jgi:hypothetical protein